MSIKPYYLYFPIKTIGYRALYDIYHIILHTYMYTCILYIHVYCTATVIIYCRTFLIAVHSVINGDLE